MKLKYSIFLMVAIAAASCVKETNNDEFPVNNSKLTITAQIQPTKVNYRESDTYSLQGRWEVEDEIVGFTENGKQLRFEVTNVDAETGTACLELTSNSEVVPGDKVHAIYCPGLAMGEINPSGTQIDFSNQTAEDIPGVMLADAQVSEQYTLSLGFHNVVAIVGINAPSINVPASGRTIQKAIISGHEVASSGKITLQNGILEFTSNTPSTFIVKNVNQSVTAENSLAKLVLIAVPPSKIDKISFLDNHNSIYSYCIGKSSASKEDKSADAGKYYRINSRQFNIVSQPVQSGFIAGGVNWAKYNLGGSTTTGANSWGELYRWGDDSIIYTEKSSSGIVFDSDHQSGYSDYTGEIYWTGTTYSKYTETDGKTVLDPVDDPVQLAYPGTNWRMPTKEEFEALVAIQTGDKYTVTYDPNSNKGVKYEDGTNALFFPRNQIVSADKLATRTGRYWTSTLCNNNDSGYPYRTGYYFQVNSSSTKTGTIYRRDGLSIRPVRTASHPSPEPEPEPERPKMNQGKSVKNLPEWTDISIDYSLLTSNDHPRLFLFNNDFIKIKKQVNDASNVYLKKLHDNMMAAAVIMARTTRPLEYQKDESGKSITQISRKAIHRIVDLAYAYRYTGEDKYLKMAEWNMNVVCDFPDWNDEHFLDAAEMATAVGIGYDWLKKDLADSTLEKIPAKLKAYALDPGLARNIYKREGNWNQVCCGGLIVAALSIYEIYPELADEVIRKCMAYNANEVKNTYAPSGAFPEGPGYWEYGTCYEGILCLALETALGSDFEIPLVEGFQGAGDFYVFDRGNTGKRFNYSDSGESDETSFGLWYLAYKQKNPSFLYQDLARLDDDTYLHEYYTFMAITASYLMGNVTATHPSGRLYRADNESINPVLMCRTGWGTNDPYLAIKGGSCNVSHAHMDAGEVVYEQYGTRWFKDFTYTTNYTELRLIFKASGLSSDELGKLDVDSWRWKVFQYHNRQHSTITANDANHWPYGKARIYEAYDSENELGGYVDLTDTFYGQLHSANRKAVIKDNSYLEITDKFTALNNGKAAHIRWTCGSDASPRLVKGGIELDDGATKMKLVNNAPDAVYKIWSVDPNDYPTELERGEDPLDGYLCGFEFNIPAGESVTIVTTLKKK